MEQGMGWSLQNLGFTGTCYQVAKVDRNPGLGVSTAGQMYFYITRITDSGWGNSSRQKHFILSCTLESPQRFCYNCSGHEMSKSCLVSPACGQGGLPGWDELGPDWVPAAWDSTLL